MVWFKVDDNLAFHPKVLRAGNAAMGLWVRAGSWSAQQLTDGVIPDSILLSLGTVKQAQALVAAGLWDRAAGAWSFHEWNADGRQPTRAKVEAERAAAAERQRKHREDKGSSRRDNTVTTGVTNAEVTGGVTPTPTRPDPTRPIEEAKASSPKARETALPSAWAPTADHIKRGKELGVDVLSEAENFRLFADAHERRAVNWNAAFTMWLKKAKPRRPNTDWALRQ